MRAAIDANAVFLADVTAGKLFEEQCDRAAGPDDVDNLGSTAETIHDDRSGGCTDDVRDGNIRSSNFDMGKVRSTLRQYAREWSVEGEPEREQSFGRLLRSV
jgi:hypothetical protein